tara:strand:- start:1293 stop:1493 length:201 start_codon:yes stop_codon:yes gene_type:complete
MKIFIILLLSTTGIEEIKLKTNGLSCGELANAWREVNTTYHSAVKNDSKLQGNYTQDGKLLVGWIC